MIENLSVFVLLFGIVTCLLVLIVYLFVSYKRLLGEIRKKNAMYQDCTNIRLMGQELAKQMENEVARRIESDNAQDYLFENSLNGILLVQDEDLKIVKNNPAAIDIFGGDALGRNVLDLSVNNDYKKLLLDKITEVKRTKNRRIFSMEIENNFGKRVSVVVSIHLFEFAHKKSLYFTFTDVTEIAELERELKKKKVMLVQKGKMEDMGKMLGNISHQWKQPLNSLFLLCQNLEEMIEYDECNKEKLSKYISMMCEQVRFMSKTIDEFRSFYIPSKNKENFKVVESIRSILDLFYRLKDQRVAIDFVSNDKNDEIALFGNRNEFQQVLIVLLDNSLDAIKENLDKKIIKNGKITIDCESLKEEEKEYCVIKIRDNGIGIQKEQEKHIYDNYFTTKEKGSGIGLGMVKIILEQMEGKISFKNLDKIGVEFIVQIPYLSKD